jgi:hypothetical protein
MLYHALVAGHVAGIAFLAAVLTGAPFLPAALLATGAALCAAAVSIAASVRA